MRALTPAALLAASLAADPARPLLTYYDDAAGDRVELSVATFANWAAKTANLLVHGLDLAPGDRAALLLPTHWQTAAVAMGCWSAGVAVALPGGTPGTSVAFAAPDQLDAARSSGAGEVVAVGLHPLGGPLAGVPAGVTDYGAEVLGYADSFTPLRQVDPAGPALGDQSGAELIGAARAAAQRWDLGAGDRVLSVLPYDTLDGWLAGLLAPLAAGAGIVLCRHPDEAALPHRVTAERVTATAGVTVPDVRRLETG